MAAASSSGKPRNVKSRGSYSSKKGQVNFVEGELIPIKDISGSLEGQGKDLNDSGKKMLENLEYMEPHSFEHMKQELKISHLQHVTNEYGMKGICKDEGFKIMKSAFRSGVQEFYRDLSFWTAIVAEEDVTKARKESFVNVKENIPWITPEDEGEFGAQFANSPAFKPASRFGNFKFSFQFSYLLDQYQTENCGDKEPQLRILGTDLYKQEITHYILVHSPDNIDKFKDIPMVPTDRDGHSFVYIKDKSIYWTPESTSISLKFYISKDSPRKKANDQNSLWNHLVIVFHLPKGGVLNIPKEQLLENLTACSILQPALIREHEQLELEKAEEIVKKMKSDYKIEKGKESPQVENGAEKMEENAETGSASVSDGAPKRKGVTSDFDEGPHSPQDSGLSLGPPFTLPGAKEIEESVKTGSASVAPKRKLWNSDSEEKGPYSPQDSGLSLGVKKIKESANELDESSDYAL